MPWTTYATRQPRWKSLLGDRRIGVQQQMVLLKSNKTLYLLDITLGDWHTLDGTTLTEIKDLTTWPYTAKSSPLTDEQVALPSFVRYMPGDYMHLRYGFKNKWLKFVQVRRVSAAQTPSGSIGSGLNFGGTDVTMESPIVLPKGLTTAGNTWTPVLRAATTAPAPAVENPTVAPIQQVSAQTSGSVQSAFVTMTACGQQQSQPLLIQPVTTKSHSVVPPTVASASFIPVSTLSVTLSSSTSTSGFPGSTMYRQISVSTNRFSMGTNSISLMFQSTGLNP